MDGAPATQQMCYRHPDREANVRCTRCDRPVCPECMVSASVGFQCPQCVQQGHQGSRAPRTAFGGRVVSHDAVVTKSLIAVNVVVWLLALSLGDHFVMDLELVGRGVDYSGQLVGVAEGPDQWYRLLTAMFLHQAVAHIALNMLSLWWLGPALETALGRVRFLTLYLLAGLGGSAASFMLADANQASLGASGAIFGLLGGLGVVVHKLGGDTRPIIIVLVLNLAITFAFSGIDWRAHIGGLVMGGLVAAGMVYAPRQRRTQVQVLTCVGAVLLIVVMVWVGTVRITG
ncbi:Rhomboid family protein [Wenjunlia vitaminophila]|uniref:Rhomboid family protein n=1 Tax=Wenjunlia vitaminophila TaxID=76728 RepID=A0A0T6LMU6_WENVI|nr:rhomboid family intramembrane serine protease [Wenjunlia vitaminophila]KRV47333.1 Rhomboid family protein [Wenjunlia vitaminophila]